MMAKEPRFNIDELLKELQKKSKKLESKKPHKPKSKAPVQEKKSKAKEASENAGCTGCIAVPLAVITVPFATFAAKGCLVTYQTGDWSNLPAVSGALTLIFGVSSALMWAISNDFQKSAEKLEAEKPHKPKPPQDPSMN